MSKPQSQSKIPQKQFDPAKIIKITRSIQEFVDPDLGSVRYVTLRFNDVIEIAKYPGPLERSLHTLHRMLAPANPGLTVETIKLLPADVAVRLLSKLQEMNVFLPVEPNQVAEAVALSKGEIKASNTGEEPCKTASNNRFNAVKPLRAKLPSLRFR